MSDHDNIPPETDDEIRARLRAFARQVTENADTEAALRRMPRRSRPPIVGLLAIAACLLAVVALAAAVAADRQSVDTTDLSDSPTLTTDCPSTIQPRVITQGAQMKNRFAAPVASVATAIMLLGACSDDDGPTTLARGDVEFDGTQGLGAETMDITAEEQDGEVTGVARFNQIVVEFECADTDTDGLVILGGEVTTPSGDGTPAVGERMAVIIREGDPDRVDVWLEQDDDYGSCQGLLEAIPEDLRDGDSSTFVDVTGGDIETG